METNLFAGNQDAGPVKKAILDSENYQCTRCGSRTFKEAFVIKKVSGVVMGVPKDYVSVPIPLLVCDHCGLPAPNIKDVNRLLGNKTTTPQQ